MCREHNGRNLVEVGRVYLVADGVFGHFIASKKVETNGNFTVVNNR